MTMEDLRERAIRLVITKTTTPPSAARSIVGAISDHQVQALLDADRVAPVGQHVEAALAEIRTWLAAQKATVASAVEDEGRSSPPVYSLE